MEDWLHSAFVSSNKCMICGVNEHDGTAVFF